MKNIVAQKTCSLCKKEKETRYFNKDKSRADGLSYVCRACSQKRSNLYYKNHIEERLAKYKKYREDNKERLRVRAKELYFSDPKRFNGYVKKWTNKNIDHVKTKQKEWRENNVERIKKTVREWADANKDRRALSAEKRRKRNTAINVCAAEGMM